LTPPKILSGPGHKSNKRRLSWKTQQKGKKSCCEISAKKIQEKQEKKLIPASRFLYALGVIKTMLIYKRTISWKDLSEQLSYLFYVRCKVGNVPLLLWNTFFKSIKRGYIYRYLLKAKKYLSVFILVPKHQDYYKMFNYNESWEVNRCLFNLTCFKIKVINITSSITHSWYKYNLNLVKI